MHAVVHVRLRTIKGNKYLYLYASERVDGQPRSKYLAYLGRAGSNVRKKLPREYRFSELVERVMALEFDAVLDEVLDRRHDMLVRLG